MIHIVVVFRRLEDWIQIAKPKHNYEAEKISRKDSLGSPADNIKIEVDQDLWNVGCDIIIEVDLDLDIGNAADDMIGEEVNLGLRITQPMWMYC